MDQWNISKLSHGPVSEEEVGSLQLVRIAVFEQIPGCGCRNAVQSTFALEALPGLLLKFRIAGRF
jgi:hypothetical protein